MKNTVRVRPRNVKDLLLLHTHENFHDYLLSEAIDRYKFSRLSQGRGLGKVFALCASHREALTLKKYEFQEIILSGITDPDQKLLDEIKKEPRIKYWKENSECLSQESKKYDLVLCKEGLHHLARPVLGFYEMLRLTKDHVVIIEPAQTLLGDFLEKIGLASTYERNQGGNMNIRDNYVYRWSPRQLVTLLNSYYLESGYSLNITLGWMSSRFNAHPNRFLRLFFACVGWMIGFIPGSRGNYLSAVIRVGDDIPPDPVHITTNQHGWTKF